MSGASGDSTWWGAFEIATGACRHWRIGSLDLWLQHLEHEWILETHTSENLRDRALDVAKAATRPQDDEQNTVQRFASSRIDGSLTLAPVLADRPVVVRPEHTFSLLAGDEVSLYVTTPVWIRIESGDPKNELTEIPSFRPSDTWFGANTREGEICYASRTTASLELAKATLAPGRAVTVVTLRNRAEDALVLERLKLPIPNLPLHADAQGRLWTDRVTLERKADGEEAEIRLDRGPPMDAGKTERIAEPRAEEKRNVLVRAVSGLFG